eukprot:scaffold394167_cov37-Prasinocladus_malaysianus.AAC.1
MKRSETKRNAMQCIGMEWNGILASYKAPGNVAAWAYFTQITLKPIYNDIIIFWATNPFCWIV